MHAKRGNAGVAHRVEVIRTILMSACVKYLFAAVFGALLFTLPSCSDSQKTYVIGVSQCSDDAWRRQMKGEILRETFMYGNVDVIFRTSLDDSRRQIEDIKYFINRKVDLIVVSPNESETLIPILERAYDSGIPVVVVDRKIKSEKYTAFVGADNEEIGQNAGNYIVRMSGGKPLRVVEITGLANSSPAQERHGGFLRAIGKSPNVELVAVADAGWFRDVAVDKMDSLLRVYPDIDAVFAQNDMMALGAHDAAQRLGRGKDIRFVGIDALAGNGLGMEAVADGVLVASFSYPTGGDKILQTCMDILEKRPYQRNVVLKTAVIDAENVKSELLQNAQIAELDQKMETLNGRITDYLSRYYTQKVVLFCILGMLVLIVVMLVVVMRALQVRNRLNAKLNDQKSQLEEQNRNIMELSKELEESTQAKLVFFTNISHDFRTPLTLVADPVNQLLTSPDIKDDNRRLVQLIKRNTDILLRLVNQILDFRKTENGRMEYLPEPLDLQQCFQLWNEPFSLAAVKKHMHFRFVASGEDFTTMADKAKLESVYFNLLSNAFKYTPENGTVSVELRHSEAEGKKYLCFSVSNTGSFISVEHIGKIFNRFYKSDLNHAGSGIGLALAKAFVELHGGRISVRSTEKEGTVFEVLIPVVACSEKPVAPLVSPVSEGEVEACLPAADLSAESPSDGEKPLVLVIDDNSDICSYVKSLLGSDYAVIEASTGMEGIAKANRYVPDLIICDVMMPGIDGIECCKRLKSEMQTSHIPVVMLTACALDEQRIEGYQCGADSYISKPFSAQLLLARVKNLIEGRRRLKQYFGDGAMLVKEDISDLDKDFVARFRSCVEAHLSESELSVEDIGAELGMSRVQLYRKLKSLTNYTPVELLRITRLKRAHSLLVATDKTAAEIAYETGFSSPSYFAKCYKDYFGATPTSRRQ